MHEQPTEEIRAVVQRSTGYRFRSRFHLRRHEQAIVARDGMKLIRIHAADLLDARLAPAHPRNDGKQTPWGGHPVFRAQHATGTCCRGCLYRLYGIAAGRAATAAELEYVWDVVSCGIGMDLAVGPALSPPSVARRRSARSSGQGTLF